MRTTFQHNTSVADELAFIELSFETQEMIKRLVEAGYFWDRKEKDNYSNGYHAGRKAGFIDGVISTRPFPKIAERKKDE